jgi:hypothetical protein
MKKFYKKFTSKVEMITEITGLTTVFDTKAMLDFIPKSGRRRLYLITSDGDKIACDNFKKFISIISVEGDLQLLYPICFGRGEEYHIFSKVDYFGTEGEPFVPEIKIVEELDMSDLLSLDVDTEEEDNNNTVITEDTEEEEEEKENKDVDWDMINKLENKKYDKVKLDEYAEKEFGIKLNQRNTLANMIKDLEDQLAAK